MGPPLQLGVSPWPHRLALALALATFPLIWVGGLVTTYDAGMAVPDWPGTYGYNLLLYPWQSWLAAPWDLFIEHGHRLAGAAAGILAIGLVVAVWLTDRRRWLLVAAVGALILVVFQGLLGGARVLFDQRLVALLHGCVGAVFFAYLAGLVVATSNWWQATTIATSKTGSRFARSAWVAVGLTYVLIVLGAVLRHVPLSAPPAVFRAALLLHLIFAASLAIHVVSMTFRVCRLPRHTRGLTGPGVVLAALVLFQLLLGAGTYAAKYAFPSWLGAFPFAAAFVIEEKSLAQSLITTAHVANGSLILFASAVLAVRSTRLFFVGQAASLPYRTLLCDTLADCPYEGSAV